MARTESVVVTVFPVLFLILLFGGGAALRRRSIEMDGEPPIDTKIFYISKYAILGLWGAMVAQNWGVGLSFVSTPGWLRWISLFLWVGGFLLRYTRVQCHNSYNFLWSRISSSRH